MGNYYTIAEARIKPLEITEDEADDTELEIYISEAESAFEQFCNKVFYARTLVIERDGSGNEMLVLSDLAPIQSISKLAIEDDTLDSEYFKIYSDAGYIMIKKESANVFTGSSYYTFPRGTKNIEITGVFGFATVPALIKKAVRMMIEREIRPSTKVGKYDSERLGDYSYKIKSSSDGSIADGVFTGDAEIDAIIQKYQIQIDFRTP